MIVGVNNDDVIAVSCFQEVLLLAAAALSTITFAHALSLRLAGVFYWS